MGEYTTTIIAIVVATFFSRIYYKGIKTKGNKRQRFIEKAKKNRHFTTGYYVSSTTIFGDPNSEKYNRRQRKEHVRYEYTVNGVKYAKYLLFQSEGITVDFPLSVTVYYDPRKPQKAACQEQESRASQMQTGCVGSVAIWLVIAAVVLNVLEALLR